MDDFNEINRFGSAGFADERAIERAGLFQRASNSVFVGFLRDRPLFYSGEGGLLLTAGARGGKLATVLGYNVCAGVYAHSMLVLDMKGELAAISQDQTPGDKFCIYWNPAGLGGLNRHAINPVDFIRIDSPTLVSDVKVFCEIMIPLSGSPNGAYFERRGRQVLEAIVLTLVRVDGVLTLPRLYEVINLIPGGGERWLDFAFEMNQAPFPICASVEEEIAHSRTNPSNGFQGIMGEVFKAFACLSDPVLLRSVSPPFDFSLSELTSGTRAYHLYLCPPAEFIQAWSPVIKALFMAGMIYKARAPAAPRQTWLLDECAQLGAFELVPKLFTYGAGIGIRPWAVFQSTFQMNALGPDAENIIMSSASLRCYFAVRDIHSASAVSRMLGSQTLEYDDQLLQARARHAKHEVMQAILDGDDPLTAGLGYAHHRREAETRSKQQRLLRTPDEIVGAPRDKQFIFCDALREPLYADRKPYFEQAFMAGRYHPNPYHPPLDRVRVKTALGHAWRRVIREPVPARYAHFPQYRDGYWSRIEGTR